MSGPRRWRGRCVCPHGTSRLRPPSHPHGPCCGYPLPGGLDSSLSHPCHPRSLGRRRGVATLSHSVTPRQPVRGSRRATARRPRGGRRPPEPSMRSWWVTDGLAWPMGWRLVRRHPLRSFLLALAVAVPVALGAAVASVAATARVSPTELATGAFGAADARVGIAPRPGDSAATVSRHPLADDHGFRAVLPPGVEARWDLDVVLPVRAPNGRKLRPQGRVLDLADSLLSPIYRLEEGNLRRMRAPSHCRRHWRGGSASPLAAASMLATSRRRCGSPPWRPTALI
jgi:hypothetical protein